MDASEFANLEQRLRSRGWVADSKGLCAPSRVVEAQMTAAQHNLLAGVGSAVPIVTAKPEANKPANRIRQDAKPLLNKLETDALAWLKSRYPCATFHAQAWRVKIANGAWFKVDLCAVIENRWTAWECKEFKGKNVDRGLLALKTAAHQFPEVQWVLLSRKNGQWNEQVVLP